MEEANKDQLHKEIPDEPEKTYDLPPDIALVRYMHLDPKMLDKALCSLNAKEWMEALQYGIRQLEKLGTWEVVDLTPGQSAIPCSEVVRVKHGPDSEVQSYRIRIVAGATDKSKVLTTTKPSLLLQKCPLSE